MTRAADDAESVRRLINFGFDSRREISGLVGINGKMDELHAAMALAALDGFDDVLAARRARAATLRQGLLAAGYAVQACSEMSAFQFVPCLALDATTRDRSLASAERAGIEVRSYFSPPLHRYPAFRDIERADDLRVTEHLSRRTLSLPMANDLSDEAVASILAATIVD